MSPHDAPLPSPYRTTASSFVDVFKTLGVARPRSQSPVSPHAQGSNNYLSHTTDGRKNNFLVLGFEPMHRGSVVSSSSDTSGALDFETAIKNLSQKQYLAHAIDEAEHVSRGLQSFNSDQSIALWEAGSYLIHHVDSPDARRSGSLLLETVAARQDLTPAARRTIFESISSSSEPDVIPARVQSLISLSDHGRKLDFTSVSVLSILSSCAVPLYELISSARLKARKAKVGKVNGLGYEESALDNMLQFAVDLITLQRKRPSNEEIESLLPDGLSGLLGTHILRTLTGIVPWFSTLVAYHLVGTWCSIASWTTRSFCWRVGLICLRRHVGWPRSVSWRQRTVWNPQPAFWKRGTRRRAEVTEVLPCGFEVRMTSLRTDRFVD